MYHIFVLISLMASQKEINHVKDYNHTIQKSQLDKPTQETSGGILNQFKKAPSKENEGKKVAANDLESFGLDSVDVIANKDDWDAPSKNQASNTDKDFVNTKVVVKAEKKKSEILVAPPEVVKLKAEEQSDKVEVPSNKIELPKILPNEKDKKFEVAKDLPIPLPVPAPVIPSEAVLVAKPSEQDKAKLDESVSPSKLATSLQNIQNKLKNITGIGAKNKLVKESTNIAGDPEKKELADTNKKITSKKKNKNNKELRQRMAMDDKREKNKLVKLNQLRAKYLVSFDQIADEENFELNGYQNKIIPHKKAESKIIDVDVPVQLLERARSEDNKYNPTIMTYEERVKFMFQAISQGRIDDFDALYYTVKRPNLKNSDGDTLLTFSVLMRKYRSVSSLLSKGADPNLPNSLRYTPMNLAIELEDYKSVLLLARMGADINFADELGRTYLMQAVRVGSLSIADFLVANGVNVNLGDRNGMTALGVAYKYDRDILAKFLLKNGAKNSIPQNYEEKKKSLIEELNSRWDRH